MNLSAHEDLATRLPATTSGTRSRQGILVVAAIGALGLPSTSSRRDDDLVGDAVLLGADATSGGPIAIGSTCEPILCPAQVLGALRRVSGLTWEYLGRVFDVSRRTIHFWASGQPMSQAHEELLRVVFALLSNRPGDAARVRAALLSQVNGQQVLALLIARRFPEADAALNVLVGPRQEARTVPHAALSPAAQVSRMPLAPAVLATSEEEIALASRGRGRAAPVSRSRGRGER